MTLNSNQLKCVWYLCVRSCIRFPIVNMHQMHRNSFFIYRSFLFLRSWIDFVKRRECVTSDALRSNRWLKYDVLFSTNKLNTISTQSLLCISAILQYSFKLSTIENMHSIGTVISFNSVTLKTVSLTFIHSFMKCCLWFSER